MGTKEGPAVRAPSANFACGAGCCAAEKREQLAPLHRGSSSHAAVISRCSNVLSWLLATRPAYVSNFPSSSGLSDAGILLSKELLIELVGPLLDGEVFDDRFLDLVEIVHAARAHNNKSLREHMTR